MTKLNFKEFIFLHFLLNSFKCFTDGTIHVNILLSKNIILKIESIFEVETFKNYFDYESVEMLHEKLQLYFRTINTLKGKNRLKNYFNKNKQIAVRIRNSAKKIIKEIIKDKYIENLYNNIQKRENLILGNYLASNVGYCYFLDSTSRNSTYVTFLQDAGSRFIPNFMITETEPKADDIIELLNSAFGNRTETSEPILLHLDIAGAHTSNKIKLETDTKNIKLSFCEPNQFANQIIEGTNRILWNIIFSLRFKSDPTDSSRFDNLQLPERIEFIDHGILLFNTATTHRSLVLPNEVSPLMVQEALQTYRLSKNKMVKNYTSDGLLVRNHIRYAINKFEQYKLIIQLMNNKKIITEINNEFEQKFSQLNNSSYVIPFSTPFQSVNRLVESSSSVNRILKELLSLSSEDTVEFENSARALINNFNNTNSSELDRLNLVFNIANFATLKRQVAEREKDREVIKKLQDQVNYLTERENKKLEQENRIIRIRQQKIEQKNKRERKASNAKNGIYWGDFDVIISCTTSRKKYIQARDRVLHFLLKATGMRVGNACYLTWFQIKKFITGNSIYITSIRTNTKYIKLEFPYYSGLKPHIQKLQAEFKVMEEVALSVREKNPNFPQDTSEFWAADDQKIVKEQITIHSVTKRLNEDLKIASNLLKVGVDGLKRHITTHSYRRGVARVTNALFGISITQKLLQHVSIVTTQKYVQEKLSNKKIKQIYQSSFSVESEDDLPLTGFDGINRSEYMQGAEEAMQDEDKELKLNSSERLGNDKLADFD